MTCVSTPPTQELSERYAGKSTKPAYTPSALDFTDSDELASLIASAEELLRWEDAIGGVGFPRPVAPLPARPDPHTADAPAPTTGGEAIRQRLEVLAAEAATCSACELHRGRTHSVFARGTANTDLVFVGEGPGYHEDQQGLPFVGRAGQLLDRMIVAMGYGRDEVYVCNVVKCRPPENRTPAPMEAAACARFLVPQIEAVQPKVIVALGRCAAENLECVSPSGKWRGVWAEWRGIPVMPTYHPAFLLRSPQFKKPVWEDLQDVIRKLGRSIPSR